MSTITIETPRGTRTWNVQDGDQIISHIASLLGKPDRVKETS